MDPEATKTKEQLLAEIAELAEGMHADEQQVESKRERLYPLLRQTREVGASLGELADAAKLTRARIHQIVIIREPVEQPQSQ